MVYSLSKIQFPGLSSSLRVFLWDLQLSFLKATLRLLEEVINVLGLKMCIKRTSIEGT